MHVGVVSAEDLDTHNVAGLARGSRMLLLQSEAGHFQFAVHTAQYLLKETIVQLRKIPPRSYPRAPTCSRRPLCVIHVAGVIVHLPSCSQTPHQPTRNILHGFFAHSVIATLI